MPIVGPAIEQVQAAAYGIPTDAPEADGTFAWTETTLVVVQVRAGDQWGIGYTYESAAAAALIRADLREVVEGADAFAIPAIWAAMTDRVRNIGRRGVAACAISAVDAALWDLKAKLLELPLVVILGQARPDVCVYGSGGFTTYSCARLRDQLGRWVHEDGCAWVKMKVARQPADDVDRVEAARRAVGEAGLFVDANGALSRKAALAWSERFADFGVSWFEEPVSSDDLEGLRLLRDRAPAGMDIAAGEYGYEPVHFRRLLEAGAVDVLQPDATRCGGITGFLRAAALADAFLLPLSTHCAPALHLHAACAAPRLRHIEWFHDHARIEAMLFEGAPILKDGVVRPDLARPGCGLVFKAADAERFAL